MHGRAESYAWQAPYIAAVLETDAARIRVHIYEAMTAIEERRLSAIKLDSDEEGALRNAEDGLNALIAERLDDKA
jgi:hypothetical protein